MDFIEQPQFVHELLDAITDHNLELIGHALEYDIDAVYCYGFGYPRHVGGPMLYADTVGLYNVVLTMNRFAQNPLDDGAFWKPAPLLAKLAAEGKSFT
mgnify:CR=1 FL=1